jgi:hypothetical protein
MGARMNREVESWVTRVRRSRAASTARGSRRPVQRTEEDGSRACKVYGPVGPTRRRDASGSACAGVWLDLGSAVPATARTRNWAARTWEKKKKMGRGEAFGPRRRLRLFSFSFLIFCFTFFPIWSFQILNSNDVVNLLFSIEYLIWTYQYDFYLYTLLCILWYFFPYFPIKFQFKLFLIFNSPLYVY